MTRVIAPVIGLLSLGASAVVLHSPNRVATLSACLPDAPNVVISVIEETKIYPIYVSTYCSVQTTLIIDGGFTVPATVVPTTVITTGTCTKVVTK